MRAFQRDMLESKALDILSAPKPAAPIIHRKKLFGGRQTAQEVHAQHAFPPHATCAGCHAPYNKLQTRVIILMPLDEMRKRDREFDEIFNAAELAAKAGKPETLAKLHDRLVPTKHGPHVRISTTYGCEACTPELERAAAKAPSWCIVDINRGPGKDKAVAGWGGR